MSLQSAQFVSYLAFCLAMILLFSAHWRGNVYFIYLELVLLETCAEIFCDIFWQTHISNTVALFTHSSVIEAYVTRAMLYSTEWLVEKCTIRHIQTQWFVTEVYQQVLHLRRPVGRGPAGRPLGRRFSVKQTGVHPLHRPTQLQGTCGWLRHNSQLVGARQRPQPDQRPYDRRSAYAAWAPYRTLCGCTWLKIWALHLYLHIKAARSVYSSFIFLVPHSDTQTRSGAETVGQHHGDRKGSC
jgi:hypothetical protein